MTLVFRSHFSSSDHYIHLGTTEGVSIQRVDICQYSLGITTLLQSFSGRFLQWWKKYYQNRIHEWDQLSSECLSSESLEALDACNRLQNARPYFSKKHMLCLPMMFLSPPPFARNILEVTLDGLPNTTPITTFTPPTLSVEYTSSLVDRWVMGWEWQQLKFPIARGYVEFPASAAFAYMCLPQAHIVTCVVMNPVGDPQSVRWKRLAHTEDRATYTEYLLGDPDFVFQASLLPELPSSQRDVGWYFETAHSSEPEVFQRTAAWKEKFEPTVEQIESKKGLRYRVYIDPNQDHPNPQGEPGELQVLLPNQQGTVGGFPYRFMWECQFWHV